MRDLYRAKNSVISTKILTQANVQTNIFGGDDRDSCYRVFVPILLHELRFLFRLAFNIFSLREAFFLYLREPSYLSSENSLVSNAFYLKTYVSDSSVLGNKRASV